MPNQPISKQQALKVISATKAVQQLYSEATANWFKSKGGATPSHVVLYLDDSYKKLFVALISKPPTIVGFVVNLQNPSVAPTDVRQYTVQKTKAMKSYIMADSTKFELAGIFKSPVLKASPVVHAGIRPSSRTTLYESIASTEVVNETTGIKFHVNVEVRLDKSDREPIVSFYDSRYFTERNNVGQFVSDYFVSSIRNHRGGLMLDGGVPDWQISARNMNQIQDWLSVAF